MIWPRSIASVLLTHIRSRTAQRITALQVARGPSVRLGVSKLTGATTPSRSSSPSDSAQRGHRLGVVIDPLLCRREPVPPANRAHHVDVAPRGMAGRLAKLVELGEERLDELGDTPVVVRVARSVEGDQDGGCPLMARREEVTRDTLNVPEDPAIGKETQKGREARSDSIGAGEAQW